MGKNKFMNTITVWVTKYALSTGIEKLDVEYDEINFPNMVSEKSSIGYKRYFHGEGKDWHRTEEGAKSRAEKMRTKKINSLEMQISKLKKYSF